MRIATDNDLDAFVRQLLRLFENPKTRADLRNGRWSFRLAGTSASSPAVSRRIDSGAVTERHIVDVAASGGGLILGRKAVLTPLAREKARALGVSIQKGESDISEGLVRSGSTRRIDGLPAGVFLESRRTGRFAYDRVRCPRQRCGERVLIAGVGCAIFTGTPPPVDALIIGSIDDNSSG